MIFLSPPPQVEAISLCLLVIICPAHMYRAVTCILSPCPSLFIASWHLSSHPHRQPGKVMLVGWSLADPRLSVLVGTSTAWRKEQSSHCSPLTTGTDKNTVRCSQNKSILEGKRTLCLQSSHKHRGDGGCYTRMVGKSISEYADAFLPSAALPARLEKSSTLVQSLGTGVSPGTLQATRVVITEL